MVPPRERYTDDADELILEDELQRIKLKGKIDVHKMATGKEWSLPFLEIIKELAVIYS